MPAYYNEHDPFAAAWLRELIKEGHIADGYVDERDIQLVQPSDLTGFTQCHFFAGIGGWSYALRLAGWPDDRPVWTGSCPCQPFSSAGQRCGASDPRHLWPDFHRLIAVARPVTCFGEQVESKDGRAWLASVQADLEGSGYTLGAVAAPAAGFGAPHGRHRLYWVAESMRGEAEYIAGEGMGEEATTDGEDWCISGERLRLGVEGATDSMALSHQHQRRQECAVAGRSGEGSGTQGMEQRFVHCGDEFMAHAQHSERGSELEADGHSHRRDGFGRSCNTGPLDNPPSPRRDSSWEEPESQARDKARLRGLEPGCGDGGVGDTEQAGRQSVADVTESDGKRGESTGKGKQSGQPNFWGSCAWLPCRDHRLRPVEPGTFPLAHGVSARVGRLRGYGNAIVPQVASAFIKAYCEIELGRTTS